MRINKIDNQTFGQLNAAKADYLLFSRLRTPKRYEQYQAIERINTKNPFNIVLEAGKLKSLKASIYDAQGKLVMEKQENRLRSMLNLSPIGFLKELSDNAKKLYKESLK